MGRIIEQKEVNAKFRMERRSVQQFARKRETLAKSKFVKKRTNSMMIADGDARDKLLTKIKEKLTAEDKSNISTESQKELNFLNNMRSLLSMDSFSKESNIKIIQTNIIPDSLKDLYLLNQK